MKLENAEEAARLAADYRTLSLAVKHLEAALIHCAVIHGIKAEDEAESERSINMTFTVAESKTIFEVALKDVEKRLGSIKARLAAL